MGKAPGAVYADCCALASAVTEASTAKSHTRGLSSMITQRMPQREHWDLFIRERHNFHGSTVERWTPTGSADERASHQVV